MKKTFYVSGMTCSACSSHVNKCVSELDGVIACDVSLLTNQMVVEYENISEDEIIKAVKDAGYNASTVKPEEKKYHKAFDKLIIGIVLLVILMYIAMYDMLKLPIFLFMKNPIVNSVAQFGLTTVIIVLFFHFFKNGFKRLFKLHPNMDSLIAIGSTASYLFGIYYLILIIISYVNKDFLHASHIRHNLYFDSAAMILVFTSIGKLLEAKSKKKALQSVEDLVNMVPNTCNVIKNGVEVNTSLKDVNIGDILISRVGDIIPLDGIVVSGEASINEATITGEAMAIDKFIDSTVISGTLVLDGVITYKVTSTKESSTITQITKRVIEAANSKPKIEKLADRISLYFVPAVILISIITFTIWMIITKDFSTSFNYAVSVLVISCPCALGLATPVAVMVASGVGAKNNLLFKDSEVLEKLSTIDVILLDKTGTITDGTMKVSNVVQIKTDLPYTLEHLIGSMLTALDDNNQTSRALITHFGYSKDLTASAILPFSSARKISGVTFTTGETFIFGAPEFVLKDKYKLDYYFFEIIKECLKNRRKTLINTLPFDKENILKVSNYIKNIKQLLLKIADKN